MKNILLALVAVFGISAPALASTGDLLHFFEAIEGNWQGSGVETYFNENPSCEKYDLSLDVDYGGQGTWRMINTITNEEGTQTRVGYLAVRGDALWLAPAGEPAHPVAVIESSSKTLGYRYQIFSQGQVYEYSLSLALADDGSLTGSTLIESNGTHVAEDHFTLAPKAACTPGAPMPAPSATPSPIPPSLP